MYNSDGYVLIDLTGVDITKTNQHLTGIYNRVLTVIDINKLALVINAGDLTPMAAVVHKRLNYYVINTPLYIFTINSNDIIIIEEAGEATVDVAIVPTLLDGVKIADFTNGSVEGSLYAPEQQSEINDNITTDYTTWSSDKINTALSSKANATDVYTKAQVDTALSGKADTSDIPTKTSQLQNDSGFLTSAQVPTIDDSSVSSSSVWSSFKISGELATKANVAETTAALALKANSADVYTKSEVDTALAAKANLALTNPTYESNTKISQQGTICCKSGKLITFSSVFRAQNTQIGAGETIWTIKNENIKGTSPDSEVYIPYVVDSGEGYGYLLARNSGSDIIIKTNSALQMPKLMFLNSVIPTI